MSTETVEVNKEELAELVKLASQVPALIQQVQTLVDAKANQDVEGNKLKARPVNNRTVTIMFIDGQPIVGIENVGTDQMPVKLYEVADPFDKDKRILTANLQVLDTATNEVKTIKGVNFLEFIQQAERRECDILKMTGEQWVIEQGTTMKRVLEGDKYQMKDLGIEVPLAIEGTDYEYVVDIDGKPVTIHQDYVNMAKSTPKAEKVVINKVTQ